MSVGLLTFSRNNVGEVTELVRRMRTHVDETVVVDSSDRDRWSELEQGVNFPKVHVVRAIPTAYLDLLLPFGVSMLDADWIFQCEPDEEPSDQLISRLRNTGEAAGFVVPRYEASVRAFTHHLRLFRKSCFSPQNPAFGFPTIRGRVVRLPRSECLAHHRDYSAGITDDYRVRVMDLESIERPFDLVWLRDSISLHSGHRAVCLLPLPKEARDPRRLSRPAITLGMLAGTFLDAVRFRSWEYSVYAWKYRKAALAFVSALPPEEVSRRYAMTLAARRNGGLIRYLGFDDPEYVQRLTSSFTWDLDGLAVLHTLLQIRFEQGSPMSDWSRNVLTRAPPADS